MHPLFASLPLTIFERMSGLAREHGAINLGQGFPDFGWSPELIEAAAFALREGSNQYAPSRGLPELRSAVADHYRRHQGLEIGPDHVTVTSGATEAIAAAITAIVSEGDEVVLFEPLYDCYLPLVLRVGGVPRFVRLSPPEWRIRADDLAAAITERTRLVIFNNPHNPTGRLFDEEELALVARACCSSDALALSDEVWEEVLFDGRRFMSLAAMPGMAERTVKIGSAGKIFSLTGWKVGWLVAPPHLSEVLARAHQFLAFATAPHLQKAVAFGLDRAWGSVAPTIAAFEAGRDRLGEGLRNAGFSPLPAEATYFMTLDLTALGIRDDRAFCERAAKEAKIAAIPLSPFYVSPPGKAILRLCFAKGDETLDLGVERLAKARTLYA